MSDKKFIAFLAEKDGRVRQIVNGVVTSLNNKKMLPQMPDGNQEISIGYERSMLYWGTIVNFSIPLGFVMEAATILRNDFYKFNLDRQLDFILKRLTYEFTDTTFKEYYKQFYKGELDFSTAEDNQGEHRFEANIMDGGLHKLIKAAENTKFYIPFDLDAKNIKMDGMYIEGTYRWTLPESGSESIAYVGMYELPNDNPVPGLSIFSVMEEVHVDLPNADSTQYFASASQDIEDVVITGQIVNLNPSGVPNALNMRMYVYNVISDTIRISIDLTPDDPYPGNYTLQINETLDLLAGDRIFFFRTTKFSESSLQLYAQSRAVTSYVKAFTLYDAWRKLVEKATGNADNFQSTLLESTNILLTSGDGVRGITNAGIKLSIKELWQATDAYLMASMQIGTKVRIEGRSAAFVPESVTPAIELGEVKNFKCTNATEFMGTSIKVGHAEQQVDDTNGKFDYNGFQIYQTPNTRIESKEINIQSPFKAGPYEIEQTRANYEGKTTTDKDTDNDIFAIAAIPENDVDTFETDAIFQADGAPFAPGLPFLSITAGIPQLRPGMKIRFTNTVSNNVDRIINTVAPWFFGQLITLTEPVIDETSITPITIEILEGQVYILDRTISIDQLVNPDVSDKIKETVYNIPLTPKRMLQNHYPWLAGVFWKYAPASLVFDHANRNEDLISGGITEKASVPIANMGAGMFIPKWFEFETIVPTNITEVHETNPSPVFGFIWKGVRYTGFQWRDGFAASTLEEQKFKLLACPDNDLNSLI